MYVLYQFDNKYAPYAGISLLSLIENNREGRLTVYIAAIDISDSNMKKFEKLFHVYGITGIWLNTQDAVQKIRQFRLGSWNSSYATWLKVFVLDQIPANVKRILYVDCDTLIVGKILDLFSMELGGKTIGAVLDCLAQYDCKRLGVKQYYNAGVTLYDMEKMRGSMLIEKMLSHLERNVHRYPVNDQDLLNDFFKNQIFTLPLKYNLQGFLLMYKTKNYVNVYKQGFYNKQEIIDAKEKPVVIHFFRIFGNYPWESGNMHACSQMFHEWQKRSPWADKEDLHPRKKSIFEIEKILYRILPQPIFLRFYKMIVEH